MNQNYNHRKIKFLILSSLSWGDLFGWQDVKIQSLPSQHSLSPPYCLCLFVCLSLSVSVCLCLSVCLPACMSVCLSVCLSLCLSLSLSVQHNCTSISTFNKQGPWIEEGDYLASDFQMARLPWSPRGKQPCKEYICMVTSSCHNSEITHAAG